MDNQKMFVLTYCSKFKLRKSTGLFCVIPASFKPESMFFTKTFDGFPLSLSPLF